MSFPAEIRTVYDADVMQGAVDVGGVEWEQEDRRLATERAAMLRAASIDVERVRPAVRNDQDAVAPMRGVWIGLLLGLAFWAIFLAGIYVVTR